MEIMEAKLLWQKNNAGVNNIIPKFTMHLIFFKILSSIAFHINLQVLHRTQKRNIKYSYLKIHIKQCLIMNMIK